MKRHEETEGEAPGLEFPSRSLTDVSIAVIARTQHAAPVADRAKVDVRDARCTIAVQFDDMIVHEGLEVGLIVIHQTLEGRSQSLSSPNGGFKARVHLTVVGKKAHQGLYFHLPDMVGVETGEIANRLLVHQFAHRGFDLQSIHSGII